MDDLYSLWVDVRRNRETDLSVPRITIFSRCKLRIAPLAIPRHQIKVEGGNETRGGKGKRQNCFAKYDAARCDSESSGNSHDCIQPSLIICYSKLSVKWKDSLMITIYPRIKRSQSHVSTFIEIGL